MQLTGRERNMVIGAGAALVFFVLFQFILSPLLEQRDRLLRRLVTQEKALVHMEQLQKQYRQLSQQSGSMASLLESRESGFSLFAFLEQNADESSVKEQIAYMKPSESEEGAAFSQTRVEMKLQGVSLPQLIEFVEKSESPTHLVGISKMTIQENSNEKRTLDATFVMVSVDQPAQKDER
nr:type II secretion system protein GspM [uncultured Desulfobulbus sp.]